MKRTVGLCGAFLLVLNVYAEAAERGRGDEVAKAISKLDEKENYSWTSTSKREGSTRRAPSGPTEGRIEKKGFAHLKTKQGDTTVEGIVKGQKAVVKVDSDWKPVSEITREAGFDWRNPAFRMARTLTGFRPPVADAQLLLANVEDLSDEGEGVHSGKLSPEGVSKAILGGRRRGDNPPTVEGAEGTVKFWIKEGLLTKYELKAKGKVKFGEREISLDRTTTVEIKKVGSTEIEIPAEAKEKLE